MSGQPEEEYDPLRERVRANYQPPSIFNSSPDETIKARARKMSQSRARELFKIPEKSPEEATPLYDTAIPVDDSQILEADLANESAVLLPEDSEPITAIDLENPITTVSLETQDDRKYDGSITAIPVESTGDDLLQPLEDDSGVTRLLDAQKPGKELDGDTITKIFNKGKDKKSKDDDSVVDFVKSVKDQATTGEFNAAFNMDEKPNKEDLTEVATVFQKEEQESANIVSKLEKRVSELKSNTPERDIRKLQGDLIHYLTNVSDNKVEEVGQLSYRLGKKVLDFKNINDLDEALTQNYLDKFDEDEQEHIPKFRPQPKIVYRKTPTVNFEVLSTEPTPAPEDSDTIAEVLDKNGALSNQDTTQYKSKPKLVKKGNTAKTYEPNPKEPTDIGDPYDSKIDAYNALFDQLNSTSTTIGNGFKKYYNEADSSSDFNEVVKVTTSIEDKINSLNLSEDFKKLKADNLESARFTALHNQAIAVAQLARSNNDYAKLDEAKGLLNDSLESLSRIKDGSLKTRYQANHDSTKNFLDLVYFI